MIIERGTKIWISIKNNRLKIIVKYSFITFSILGFYLEFKAIDTIHNYFCPYIFTILWGGLGLFFGFLLKNRIIPYFKKLDKNITKYNTIRLLVINTIVGFTLFIGVEANQSFSKLQKVEDSIIIKKTHNKERYTSNNCHKLYFKVNGDLFDKGCEKNNWKDITVGEKIKVEVYKSK